MSTGAAEKRLRAEADGAASERALLASQEEAARRESSLRESAAEDKEEELDNSLQKIEVEQWMLALTKPKFFVPVHGEHRMLVQHSKTGHSMGVPVNNTMIIQNGDVVELTPDSLRKGDPVKAGIELLDQARNGIVDARVLKERQQLAVDGVVTILSAISTDGAMVAPPRVNLRGVVTTADARKMSLWTEREITWVLENRWKQLSRNTGDKAPEVDWMGVQREVEVGLSRRMRRELQVEPLILCLVQPAPGGTPTYKGRADAEPDVVLPSLGYSSAILGNGKPYVVTKTALLSFV